MYDVCVVGHVTRETIRIAGHSRISVAGGTVYYTGIALASLGLRVSVLTKVSPGDRDDLLRDFRDNRIELTCSESARTTVFENTYPSAGSNERTQRLFTIADPFSARDLIDVQCQGIHLGPLTPKDFSRGLVAEASRRARIVSLDVQGLARRVQGGVVVPGDRLERPQDLAHVDILKASASEATAITGFTDMKDAARQLAELGASEVLITFGKQGSLVYAQGKFHNIASHDAGPTEDTTGCGDTYCAGYLAKRLASTDVIEAARFASVLAGIKATRPGPLTRELLSEASLSVR